MQVRHWAHSGYFRSIYLLAHYLPSALYNRYTLRASIIECVFMSDRIMPTYTGSHVDVIHSLGGLLRALRGSFRLLQRYGLPIRGRTYLNNYHSCRVIKCMQRDLCTKAQRNAFARESSSAEHANADVAHTQLSMKCRRWGIMMRKCAESFTVYLPVVGMCVCVSLVNEYVWN